MKTENETATPTSTPATTYAATQWASSQIPIDPALQQQQPQHATTTPYQHYQAYTSHYPQATYGHYGYSTAVTPSAAVAQTPVPAPTRPAAATAATTSGGGVDTSDIANLNDALGSAGVDLRAEEETLQKSHEQQPSYRSFEDRTRKQPPKPSFDTRFLGTTMRTIGTQHKITKVPDDSTNYLALALRARLQDLITAMIKASHHRNDTQFDRPASLYENGTPMWSITVRSDVAKQLAALEKIEREEETRIRRERKERQDMAAAHAAALAAQANGAANSLSADGFDDMDGGAKKKRKKEGPGVTARNMSEDVRKKMSNAVATQAAGLGGKYAWMNASAAATSTPKVKTAATAATTTTTSASATTSATATATNITTTTGTPAVTNSPNLGAGASTSATTTTPGAGAGSSWARPYVPTKKASTPYAAAEDEEARTLVTMRDAMFVIEKERGHGAGRGAARGWV